MYFIDTHIHIDGEEFDGDRDCVVSRAKEAGVVGMYVPAIDYKTTLKVLDVCTQYAGYMHPMAGLHPEEVKEDWREQIEKIKEISSSKIVAIGEVGLDFYWSREYEKEQLEAFETQVRWSVETRLPLMIHCRKAQNEMVAILKKYRNDLPGGVFHCFTGNEKEATELLYFDNFVLGIGGVLTFKKSKLPEVMPLIPLDRIVLETDAPYMAPTPMRGKRNESAYITFVIDMLATCYGTTSDEIANITTNNANRILGKFS